MQYLRTQYLLAFGALGAIVPFQPMLLHNIGISDWHLGLILATPGLAAVLSPILVSYIADRHLSSRKLIVGSYLISALALAGLFFLSSVEAVIALTLVLNFLYAPAIALLDVVSLHALRHNLTAGMSEREFPLVRRWGSVGFMLPAIALAALTSLLAIPPEVVYLIGASLSGVAAFFALALPELPPEAKRSRELPTLSALRILFTPPLATLIWALFIASIGVSMFYFIMPRYLQELGLSMGVVGLVVILGVAWEIVLLSIAPRVLERWGTRATTIGGFGLTAVRFLLLAAIPSVAVAALTQILHAPLILVLAVILPVIFTQAATPATRNSVLGVASSIYNGFARIIGPPIAGAILALPHGSDLDQLRAAFAVGALFCAIGTAMLFIWFKPRLPAIKV